MTVTLPFLPFAESSTSALRHHHSNGQPKKVQKQRGGGREKRWLGTAGNPALKPFSKGIMQLNSAASTTGESVLYWASWKGCSSVHRKLAWNKSYCWKGTLFSLQVALQNYVILQCSPTWSCTFPMTSRKLSTCISSISILGNPVATFWHVIWTH